MFLDAPNPTQVQFTPRSKRANPPPPLVLIHDGGGTTFSYFMLGSLQRQVWAIHDPRHGEGKPWEGGIDEMARHYIELMQAAKISGTIFLGGWSLGGYLSLAIARMLADDKSADIMVAGFLIIDSPYHIPLSRRSLSPSESVASLDSPESIESLESLESLESMEDAFSASIGDWPELIQKSFENCATMLENWELPTWDGPTCRGKMVHVDVAGRDLALEPGTVLVKPVSGTWKVQKTKTYKQLKSSGKAVSPPPAVMIRCTQQTAWFKDEIREEQLLGWEGRYPEFIKAVMDIDAEHYTVFDRFDDVKMKHLTALLREGMGLLDSLYVSH